MEKEIDIYIRVIQTNPANRGRAIILYKLGQNMKEIHFSTLERTHNRSIILSSTIAMEGLKYNCIVNLYTQNNFGFKFMKNSKKWVNRDSGEGLHHIAAFGGHTVNYIDCSVTEEGKNHQQMLATKMKQFKE